jgi:hypothetical protein
MKLNCAKITEFCQKGLIFWGFGEFGTFKTI